MKGRNDTMKKYNRTLLVALLIVAVFATAIGGTFAWFTDNVEVTGNVIESGTLDIDIELKKGDSWISLEKNPETKIYNYDLWEPGYTQVETMKIVNKGNLALEYILNVVPGADEKKGPSNESLADVIDVYMAFGEKEPTSFADIAQYKDTPDYQNGWWYCGTLSKMIADKKGFTQGYMLPSGKTDAPDGVLEVGLMQGSCTCTVALHMQESADNRYQNLSLGTVGFKLEAKQYTYEEDAFNDQYDKDAQYGPGSIVDKEEEPSVELPDATVDRLPEDELLVELSTLIAGTVGYPHISMIDETIVTDDGNSIDKMKMDYGLTFIANETMDDLVGKPYENWNADFEVSVSKPITEADYTDEDEAPLVLLGNFDPWGWCPVPANLEIEADVPVRLLDSVIGEYPYSDVLTLVKTFHCGIKADRKWAVPGTSVTVKLMMYEVVDGEETENKYVVCEDTYTYQ